MGTTMIRDMRSDFGYASSWRYMLEDSDDELSSRFQTGVEPKYWKPKVLDLPLERYSWVQSPVNLGNRPCVTIARFGY